MQKLGTICAMLLFVAFVASLYFLFYHLCRDSSLDYTVVGELLLVAVLSLEGIIAVLHLRDARNDRQVDSLRELMQGLGSELFLKDREFIYKSIPWQTGDYLAIGEETVRWKRKGSTPDGDAIYHAQTPGRNVKLKISGKDKVWTTVHRVAESYQQAGLLCKRGYLSKEDFLDWGHRLPLLRIWGRIEDLIRQEKVRRGSPNFMNGIKFLVDAALQDKKTKHDKSK